MVSWPVFGEKLTNSIASIFNKGYQNIITIGSDCPKLTSKIIEQAYQQVNTNNFVIGPDTKGGVYLMAFNRSIFNPQLFQQLSWQTGKLFDSLMNYMAEEGETTTVFLTKLADFHTSVIASSKIILKNVLSVLLLKTVLSFLSTSYNKKLYYYFHFPFFTPACESLRGPPCC